MDISFFHQIIFENILILNTYAFYGIKITNGNASMVTMNSIQIRNMSFDNVFFVLNSLDSTMLINELEFSSLIYKKSKKKTNNIKYFFFKKRSSSDK